MYLQGEKYYLKSFGVATVKFQHVVQSTRDMNPGYLEVRKWKFVYVKILINFWDT